MKKILTLKGCLTDKELLAIKELEKECGGYEPLNMKLNWDMLESRSPEETNDFLYYDGERLIGFLGLYCISDPEEIEITGMIHPDYRNRGIFKELFDSALKECRSRGAKRILLVVEHSVASGKGFANSTGAEYSFTEYRMRAEKESRADLPKYSVTLRKAEEKDMGDISKTDTACFGEAHTTERDLKDPNKSIYIIEHEDKCIGKIGTVHEAGDGYIFGFGILPEYQGRGYGREAMNLTQQKLFVEQVEAIILEVAAKNDNALHLYKSCGFRELTVYDYYEKML